MSRFPWLGAVVLLIAPNSAHAATGLDGAAMAWPWALPFVGLLLSIATGPITPSLRTS